MKTTASKMPVQSQRETMGDTIADLQSSFSNMHVALRQARGEVARLKEHLASVQDHYADTPEQDLAALRRRVAFYCHPDRGGDVDVMRRLNALFDHLERSPKLCVEGGY